MTVDRSPNTSSRIRKLTIAVVGGFVLLVGLIAIPYPGPGWLIVFAGLAILAQEFAWAGDFLKYSRRQYDRWNIWIKQQNLLIQSLTFIVTVIVVVLTIWLLNGYGIINQLLNLNLPLLESPLIK